MSRRENALPVDSSTIKSRAATSDSEIHMNFVGIAIGIVLFASLLVIFFKLLINRQLVQNRTERLKFIAARLSLKILVDTKQESSPKTIDNTYNTCSNNHQIQPMNNPEDTNECAICLGPLESGDVISKSSDATCAHMFHKACITDWLMNNDTCPVCRCNYLDMSTNDIKEAGVIASSEEYVVAVEEVKDSPSPPSLDRVQEYAVDSDDNKTSDGDSNEIFEETKVGDFTNNDTVRVAALIHIHSHISLLNTHSDQTHQSIKDQESNIDNKVNAKGDDVIKSDVEIGYINGVHVESSQS